MPQLPSPEVLDRLQDATQQLVDEGYPHGEIIAALLSCSLIQMLDQNVTKDRALRLFAVSAEYAYQLQENPHAHDH